MEKRTMNRREFLCCTVNDLDNVFYEISNENHPPSTQWQYHMIRLIHDYERSKAKQHPVGMTFQY